MTVKLFRICKYRHITCSVSTLLFLLLSLHCTSEERIVWDFAQDSGLRLIASAVTLAYLDPSIIVILEVDASKHWLGAILTYRIPSLMLIHLNLSPPLED